MPINGCRCVNCTGTRKLTPEEVAAAKERATVALTDYLDSQEAMRAMRENARFHVDEWNRLRRLYAAQNAH